MFLKKVSIKDYRGIESLEIPFKSGVNILIGDNGVGKTTILEAIAIGIEGLFANVQGVRTRKIPESDYRMEVKKVADASSLVIFHGPSVELQFDIDGQEEYCRREENTVNVNSRTSTTGSACAYLKNAANDPDSVLPLLSYMGISQVTSSKRTDYGKKIKNELNDRRCGYIGCLDTIPDKNSILEWIKKMSYEASLKQITVRELNFFQATVSSFMMAMNDLEYKPHVYYSAVYNDLVYEYKDEELPIRLMSAGYQSVLWMVMDFAFRLAQLNPTISSSKEATGIVLIDEIDMHLHPKWQWNILKALESTFPQIQFIVATHAPIVISSCKNGALISINEERQIEVTDGVYGYDVQDVVTYTQYSSSVLPELRELYKNFESAYAEKNIPKAELLYESIQSEYPNSTEASKAKVRIDLLHRRG